MALKPLHRRTVLRGAGGVAVSLPFLDAMRRPARAGGGTPPPRFVVFFSANGTIQDRWEPMGTVNDFTLDVPGDPGRILAPLESWKDQLLILNGVDAESRTSGPGGNGHDMGMGHMLTCEDLVVGPSGVGEFSHLPDGSAGGPSIDQVIADQIGTDTAYRSIELGVRALLDSARQVTSRMCYRGPFEVLPPENDPAAAFAAFFSDVGADPQDVVDLRRKRHSVLDSVKEDFDQLNAKLGGTDKQKLEAHLDAIRAVETAIDAEGGQGLAGCADPGDPMAGDPNANDNYPAVGQAQMDLLAMALTCDLTRVGSLQWSTAQSGIRFSWLGQSSNHHSLSHEADNDANAASQLTAINNWYAQQFAYLLGKLAEQDEGDGTLLDNTIVMWCNEQGNGDVHSRTEIPYVIAGNHAGRLDTGRYVSVQGTATHNDLYIALANALGVELTTFGNPNFVNGPMSGILT